MGGRGGGSSIASKSAAPATPAAPAAPVVPAAPQPLERQVLDAIRNGRGFHAPGVDGHPELRQENLVMLDSVRSQLKGIPFDQVSAELKRLDRERRIHLVTHPAHYRLTAAEKAASFRMGGKDIHAVYRV